MRPCCGCGSSGSCRPRPTAPPVVPPPGRRAWSLLGWLALHPGEHARGSVAARFWPDVLDSSARASLRSALWELRRALGDDDALHAGRDRIALAARPTSRSSTPTARPGSSSRPSRSTAARCSPTSTTTGCWRRATSTPSGSAAALARLAAAAPDPAKAVSWARRRLALDPLDEDAARDLMRRLADAGDRPAALTVYDRLSDRLRESARARAVAADPRAGRRGARRAARPRRPAPRRRRWSAATPSSRSWASCGPACAPAPARWPSSPARPGSARRGSRSSCVARARAGLARSARCTAADLGGATPFAPWAELLAGLARELEPPPADAQLAGGARAARAVAAAPARPPARRAPRGAARARPRAAVRGGGRACRARHRRPAAGAALRRRPPRRRADARAGRLPRAADRAAAGAARADAPHASRGATPSTRSPTPRAAAASRCPRSRSSRSAAASSRR